MKSVSLGVLMSLGVLLSASQANSQTNLLVERRTDDTLWTMRCVGIGPVACDNWTRITGKFSSQPSLTWDASIGRYIATGVSAGKVWKGTFDADGTFNNDWTEVRGATAASSAIAARVPASTRVVTVDANGGGDFTSPVAALASITTASASNPFLVRIMPGVYNVEATPVQMKEYVDIEGSGEGVTTITGAVNGTGLQPTAAVVLGADNAQLRFITVENTFSGGFAAAIANFGVSPHITHVRAVATAVADLSTRCTGIYNAGGAPHLSDVTVQVTGGLRTYGVYNNDGTQAIMENVIIEAVGGVQNTGLRNYNGSATQLLGVVVHASSVGVADPSSQTFGIVVTESLPVLQDITVTVEGAQDTNIGVEFSTSSGTMTNASVVALGPGVSSAVRVQDSSSPILTNVTASGFTTGMEINAFGGTGTVTADRSTFVGGVAAVANDDGYVLRFGASKLEGALNPDVGIWQCAASYNGVYAPFDAFCID